MITPYMVRKKIAQFLRHRYVQLSVEDIEDVIVEVFIEWHYKNTSENYNQYGEAWIITVARRRAIDMLRRKYSQPNTLYYDPIEDGSQFVQPFKPNHYTEELNEYLALLPSAMRLLIVSHYIEGYSFEEIAQQQVKTKESIKKQTQRALLRLRSIANVS